LRNRHFGGKGGHLHEYEIAAGETVTRISGTKSLFFGHYTIGQLTITTSTGRVIGPYGHNGDEILSKFVYKGHPSHRIFAAGRKYLTEIGLESIESLDECTRGDHQCHQNAACTDTIGSYTCECNTGFEGDGRNCTGTIKLIL